MNKFLTLFLISTFLISSEVNSQGYYKPHDQITPKPDSDFEVETGPFQPNETSLADWECPDWFRDVKFGIWAHWGPQCQAEYGDWYARGMYIPGDRAYNYHVSHYGDPSVYGFKEMCRDFTVPGWKPEELMKQYYDAGARYFVQLGNHHDNFDLWDSPYQEWNCMNMGPGRDIVGGWMDACKKYGMRYGISFHAAHAWDFLDYSQDFDGNWTVEDGKGKWWEGYDPQELYAQKHGRDGNIHWYWDGPYKPGLPYLQKYQNRVLQCVSKYSPDLIYFDDTVMPFWQYRSSVGKNILTHFYNHSAALNDGHQQVVVTGKILEDSHKKFMLWDVERGVPDRCQDLPWQTCTCIGNWHYDYTIYENSGYKSSGQVVRMLVDIVSKNGNLLLSIPMNRRGAIDDKEKTILKEIGAWMKINSESIYGTRPWKVFGEGPLYESVNPLNAQGFNEGINYSNADVRFVQKDVTVYATIMKWPSARQFTFKSFSISSDSYSGTVKSVRLLGTGNVDFTFDEENLTVNIPTRHPNDIAPVFAIEFDQNSSSYESLQTLIKLVEGKMEGFSDKPSYNTGKYSQYSINRMGEQLNDAKTITEDADPSVIRFAIENLKNAYSSFLREGLNEGGALNVTGTNITTEYLIEASGFSRSDGGNTRFGTPKYWTVENFTIKNPNGTKNGIDKNPGFNTLMLGVWSGEDQGTSSDVSNARIFRKVHLDAGRYWFSAKIHSMYNLTSKAYIFAADNTCTTDMLPTQSLAYYPIVQCNPGDGKFYGIEFALDNEQDVILGFQANLKQGSDQQEFRVEAVKLLRLSNYTSAQLNTLINNATNSVNKAEAKFVDNTGYYSSEAIGRLKAYIEKAKQTNLDDPLDTADAYNLLTDAYNDFKANGLYPGGIPLIVPPYTDLTLEILKEAEHFSRTPETDNGTRFGTPLYWTVENYNIPNGNDGVKNGIDNSNGEDALMLGIWDDRNNNSEGSLTNARIYKQVNLEPGRYYFGARFAKNYQIDKAYIFAETQLVNTALISNNAMAYYDLAKCFTDGQFYGIYFNVEQTQDLFLGFQANLSRGSTKQEFLVSSVCLYKLNDAPDAIEEIKPDPFNTNTTNAIYDIQGRRIDLPASSLPKGIYIVNGKKMLIK